MSGIRKYAGKRVIFWAVKVIGNGSLDILLLQCLLKGLPALMHYPNNVYPYTNAMPNKRLLSRCVFLPALSP